MCGCGNWTMEEFVYSESGAIIGGSAGALLGAQIDDYVATKKDWPVTHAAAGWGILWTYGRALGASSGILLMSKMHDLNGNLLMAFLWPGIWAMAEHAIWSGTDINCIWPDENPCGSAQTIGFLAGFPGIPALLSVIGFNIGEKMSSQ